MDIRIAVPQDASAIAEVHVASWQQAYRELLPREFLESLNVAERESIWSKAIAKDDVDVLVAESADKILGFCAFGRCRDNDDAHTALEIYALYLDASHWSQGIGQRLWIATHQVINRKKADTVCLWVLADNSRAIHFYKAAGFEPVVDSEKTLEIGGVKLQEVNVCSVRWRLTVRCS